MKKNLPLVSILLASILGLSVNVMAEEKPVSSNESTTIAEALTDGMITTKINAQLLDTKNLNSTDISVETNNGIVTLTGTVPNDKEIKMAMTAASSVKGVKKVDVKGLVVRPTN